MKQTLSRILFLAALFTLLSGCVLPFPQATEEPVTIIEGEAQIDSIQVLVLESFPVQVNALLQGSIPDSCTSLGETTINREGNVFTITVKTSRPSNAECAQVIETFEQNVSLDVAGLPAGDYTVNAGGATASFNLAVDNSPPEIVEPTAIPSASIQGRVWHDLCAIAGGEGGEPAVPSVGCIEDAGSYMADGLLTPEEPGIEGVEVQLRASTCDGELVGSIFTNTDGAYAFSQLAAGTYCVLVDALANPNSSILIPGEWTSVAKGSALIELAEGQSVPALNFGWDYQFLPDPADLPPAEPTEGPTEEAGEPNDPDCTNKMSFVDETIDDGTVIGAGQDFTKSWTLENTGTCRWEKDEYQLVFVGGDRMGAPESSSLPHNVPPGEEVTISVELTAPNVAGTYRGDFKIEAPNGDQFGLGNNGNNPFWVEIDVEGTLVDLNLGAADWTDNFNSGSNWFQLNTENVSFVFEDGMLRMRAKTAGSGDFWGLSNQPDLEDFYLEAVFKTGDECVGLDRYGLLVRSPEPNKGYVFNVACNGQFRIYEWNGSQYNQLHAWTTSPAIKTGPEQTNKVGVWAEGNDIRLYVNGVLVAELEVDIYDEGRFGLLVGSTNTSNFDVYVDQISYWILDN